MSNTLQSPYTKAQPLRFDNHELYLFEGILTELKTSATTVNLLQTLDSTAAAMLQTYEGEATQHFHGLLNGKPIVGTFQFADRIKEGDRVKAVVSSRQGVWLAHAIMNAKTQEFYMPLNVFSGLDGLFGHCMRTARNFTIFAWVVGVIALAVFYFQDALRGPDLLVALGAVLVLPPLFMFPFELWTYRTARGEVSGGRTYGGAIFEVFGFPTPEKIDLMRHSSLSQGEDGGWSTAWRVDTLLERIKA
jgi:hypothetical protein